VTEFNEKLKNIWEKRARWKIPALLIALVLFVDALGVFDGPPQLPTCDSSAAEEMLADTIKNNVPDKTINLQLLGLKNKSTILSQDDVVRCSAYAITNTGEGSISYEFKWLEKEYGTYLIHIEEL